MLKSCGWVVVGGGGLQDFSVIPRPLGFGFLGLGLRGLGPGLDNNVIVHLLEMLDIMGLWGGGSGASWTISSTGLESSLLLMKQ